MESTIYIAEATALIEGIHILKQWIYDGSIQLLIPVCSVALSVVEEAYKASITAKDAANQHGMRRDGGKTRDATSAFDINPRTAWEFIERARAEEGITGVTFQKSNEVFTQWRDEEARIAAKTETSMPPPSSFAEALTRNKLATRDEKEDANTPPKPKLTARSKDTKTVWKIDKIPVVPTQGLADYEKALFSCALWRAHEAERDPLNPVRYVLLANKKHVRDKAFKFGLNHVSIKHATDQRRKQKDETENRDSQGQLEDQFPEILSISQKLSSGNGTLGFLNKTRSSRSKVKTQAEKTATITNEKESPTSSLPELTNGTSMPATPNTATFVPLHREASPPKINPWTQRAKMSGSPKTEKINDIIHSVVETVRRLTESSESASENTAADPVAAPIRTPKEIPEETKPLPNSCKTTVDSGDDELESDEEIIVFAPRNRRISGHPNGSRPGSSNGIVPKTYKAGVLTTSRPTTSAEPSRPSSSNGNLPKMHKTGLSADLRPTISRDSSRPVSLSSQFESIRDLNGQDLLPSSLIESIENLDFSSPFPDTSPRLPGDSKLKAQSPVFTPGQPFIPSPLGIPANTMPTSSPVTPSGTLPPTGPRNPMLHHQRSLRLQQDNAEEMLRLQRENSHRIIQRQREAVLRHSRSAEVTTPKSDQSSPRVVQMEPTDNPTIIDPDDYGRSFVVKAPTKNDALRINGNRHRGRGGIHHNNHHNHHNHHNHQQRRNRPQESPKPEDRSENGNEIEFVLTSGTPRGSTRGRGKLWVP